jgi:hypothetical protein
MSLTGRIGPQNVDAARDTWRLGPTGLQYVKRRIESQLGGRFLSWIGIPYFRDVDRRRQTNAITDVYERSVSGVMVGS